MHAISTGQLPKRTRREHRQGRGWALRYGRGSTQSLSFKQALKNAVRDRRRSDAATPPKCRQVRPRAPSAKSTPKAPKSLGQRSRENGFLRPFLCVPFPWLSLGKCRRHSNLLRRKADRSEGRPQLSWGRPNYKQQCISMYLYIILGCASAGPFADHL